VRAHGAKSEPSIHAHIYANCGPGQSELKWVRGDDGAIDWQAYAALGAAWDDWNTEHGLVWRAKNDCLGNVDMLDIHWLVTGETTRDLRAIQPRLQKTVAAFLRKHGRRTVPDPPEWERFAAKTEANRSGSPKRARRGSRTARNHVPGPAKRHAEGRRLRKDAAEGHPPARRSRR
jgi:hypothetical protein